MPEIAPLLAGWEFQPVQLYTVWLVEDAELSRQVAEAWNLLVERGEADVVRCEW